jgi:hypothetical protein
MRHSPFRNGFDPCRNRPYLGHQAQVIRPFAGAHLHPAVQQPPISKPVQFDLKRRVVEPGEVAAGAYDTKRDLVWNVNAYKLVYVLKLDATTLKTNEIAEASSQPGNGR